MEKESRAELIDELLARLSFDYAAQWVAAFDMSNNVVIASKGAAPVQGWVDAYLKGVANVSTGKRNEPSDVTLVLMRRSKVALLLGRPERPFRDLERAQLEAIARIGDVKLSSLIN